MVEVKSGDHGDGHSLPLGWVHVTVTHDSITHMVAVEAYEGHVALVEDRELDAPMAKTMTGVGSGIFTHLGEAAAKPVDKLVFAEGNPVATGCRELENEVAGGSVAATHGEEALQGGNRAED